MKILFCVEFYYPSLGGAQEVVRHLAERMAAGGHDVTVATSWIEHRQGAEHNSVKIAQFNITGNAAYGIRGEVNAYRDFLRDGGFDVILFYAAQQWTFDAAIEILDDIPAKKVFVPCGYSGLYLRQWQRYYERMPRVLSGIDVCVYHANSYRDFDFARQHKIDNGVLVPNAANLEEFLVPKDENFRERHGISPSALVLLTVGSATGLKGHRECLEAFAGADFGGRDAVLIINGNKPYSGTAKSGLIARIAGIYRARGWWQATQDMAGILMRKLLRRSVKATASDHDLASEINENPSQKKKVLEVSLPRNDLVQAFLNSDLFIFASNIEYSPLVLYEACAAGLPYLSVPVGNSEEITAWTRGGVICEAPVDQEGYTRVDPEVLASAILDVLSDEEKMKEMAAYGKQSILDRFNWDNIALEYERIFEKVTSFDAKEQYLAR